MDEESAACPGEDAAGWENGWPPGFFDLYGSSPDFPEAEDLELTSSVEQWAEVPFG